MFVGRLKPGYFYMDGILSENYNWFIQRTPLIETPARRVEMKNAFGLSGGVPFDEKAYDNTEMTLLMFIDGRDDRNLDRRMVDKKLRNEGYYKEFVPYWDDDFVYYVMNSGKTQYESPSWYGERQALEATFSVKPYKYLRPHLTQEIVITGPGSKDINNNWDDPSQPLILIEGSGDATLRINNEDFRIQNVNGHVFVDSERYITFKEESSGFITNQNSKYRQKKYPIFYPGKNSIRVSGTKITKTTIYPRWRSLA